MSSGAVHSKSFIRKCFECVFPCFRRSVENDEFDTAESSELIPVELIETNDFQFERSSQESLPTTELVDRSISASPILVQLDYDDSDESNVKSENDIDIEENPESDGEGSVKESENGDDDIVKESENPESDGEGSIEDEESEDSENFENLDRIQDESLSPTKDRSVPVAIEFDESDAKSEYIEVKIETEETSKDTIKDEASAKENELPSDEQQLEKSENAENFENLDRIHNESLSPTKDRPVPVAIEFDESDAKSEYIEVKIETEEISKDTIKDEASAKENELPSDEQQLEKSEQFVTERFVPLLSVEDKQLEKSEQFVTERFVPLLSVEDKLLEEGQQVDVTHTPVEVAVVDELRKLSEEEEQKTLPLSATIPPITDGINSRFMIEPKEEPAREKALLLAKTSNRAIKKESAAEVPMMSSIAKPTVLKNEVQPRTSAADKNQQNGQPLPKVQTMPTSDQRPVVRTASDRINSFMGHQQATGATQQSRINPGMRDTEPTSIQRMRNSKNKFIADMMKKVGARH